jgi:hypothetical protein
MAWIKASDGNTWLNLDRASRAWVQPSREVPGHFQVMANIDGVDVQLGSDTHNSESLANAVLKRFLS